MLDLREVPESWPGGGGRAYGVALGNQRLLLKGGMFRLLLTSFCAPPVASEVIGVGTRVVRAGAHARSTPGGPEQQARRDLDFFINRHEHDPLHKFVL